MSLQTRPSFLRTLTAGLAGAVAPAVIVRPARAAGDTDLSKLYDAAKKEGAVSWFTSPYPQVVAEALKAAFVKKYPGIDCQLTRQTAQVVYQKISQDLAAGIHEADVVCTSEFSHYTKWKSQNALAPFTPLEHKKIYKQFQNLDSDHAYNLGCISFVTIDYAKKLSGQQPKKWIDLTDPKWKGTSSTGHPAFSGFVALWGIAMLDKYGDGYLKKFAANNPKVGRSIFDVVTDIVGGERTTGVGVDALAYQDKAKGDPIDVQWAEDDAIIITSPMAVMREAKHPNAARLLANFYYSTEFSDVCSAAYNYPPRGDAKMPNGKHIDQIKYHAVPLEEQQAKTSEIIGKWREVFGV